MRGFRGKVRSSHFCSTSLMPELYVEVSEGPQIILSQNSALSVNNNCCRCVLLIVIIILYLFIVFIFTIVYMTTIIINITIFSTDIFSH